MPELLKTTINQSNCNYLETVMSFVTNDIYSNNSYIASDQIWNHIALISNKYAIITSLSGFVHVFHQEDSQQSHILTKQMQQPILQLRTGKFVQAIKYDVIVILHPHQLEILYLEKLENSEFQLVPVFQHNLTEACYSLHCWNHKIFVQSFYNSISLFERESLVFTRLLSEERIMLPSEITYSSNRDLVITASFSSRRVYAFKVSKLAGFKNSVDYQTVMDWQWMMPEAGGFLSLFNIPSQNCILILTRNHITKLDEFGKVLNMTRTNMRVCCTVLSNKQENVEHVKTSLILMDKNGKFQVTDTKNLSLLWNGQYKTDSGEKSAVSLDVETSSGKIFALERNGRVTCNILGSLKIHSNPQQKRLEQMDNMGSFQSMQEKLKLAYKAIQQNVKNDKIEEKVSNTVFGENVINHQFSESIDGIKLNVNCGDNKGKVSVKVNKPLTVNQTSPGEFCINCNFKQKSKLSTKCNQVIISFIFADNLKLKTKSITIPGNLLFALLFEPSNPEEIINLPIKLTLSHSLDELKLLPFINSNFLEFSSKFGNELYKLQIIPAKSGSKRVRIQVSHLSIFGILFENSNFQLEGHIPVENFAAAWKKAIKFKKKKEAVENELASISEVVRELQQEVLKITKDTST